MVSLRTVGSIESEAFFGNMLSTVTLPAGYCHPTISIVIELPLLVNLIILVSVADLIRLTNIGDYAFRFNQLTRVTFIG